MEAIDNELAKEIEKIKLKILRIKIDGKIKMRNILTLKQYLKMEQHRKQIFGKFFKHNNMKK